jgi:hypothetical protein
VKAPIDPLVRTWIVGRAAAFMVRRGRRVQCYSYRAIVRNLEKARGIRISHEVARKIVFEEDPDVARMRSGPNRFRRIKGRKRHSAKTKRQARKIIHAAFARGLQAWNLRAQAILDGRVPMPPQSLRQIFKLIRQRRNNPL